MRSSFYDQYRKAVAEGLPKYAQLRETLRAAIEGGYWAPGSQLPPETALATMVGMSLGTVQRALRSLFKAGVLIRRQGHGTFVVERQPRVDPVWHLRFLREEDGTYLKLYPKVLSRRVVKGGATCAKLFGRGGRKLIQIDRTIEIGHEFMVFSRFFLRERYRGFMEKPIGEIESANFRSMLTEEFNVVIAAMSHSFRVEPFTEEVCEAVGVSQNTMGLIYEVVAKSPALIPVYYHEICIPPNRRRLQILDTVFRAQGPG